MGCVEGGGSTFGSRRMRLGRRLLGASLGLIGALLLPAAASAIDEFPLPPGTKPGGITAGADGALWFTEEGTNSIGRITTAGFHTSFPLGGAVPLPPDQITSGPDGRLWFTETGRNKIGALNPANGAISEYPPSPQQTGGSPQGITVGPDGASLWFTEYDANRIRQIDLAGNLGAPILLPTGAQPSDITSADGKLWVTESGRNKIGSYDPASGAAGTVLEYPATGQTGGEPSSIIATAGGILWFTEFTGNAIGRLTTGGVLSEYPGAGAGPSGIAAGRDGALWFTESGNHSIGRITSGGTITNHFPTPTQPSEPSDITSGPDGALWFSEFSGDRIGRILTAPPAAPPPPPPPPVVVLRVSSLRLSPNSFKAAPKGRSISKKAKAGTTVAYSISIPASTKFTVESVQTGRKKGKKCVKQTARNRRGKKCTRYVVVSGKFKHAGKAGSNKFHFSGRIGGKKLAPGRYRLVAVATVGTRQSKLKRADFKIVR